MIKLFPGFTKKTDIEIQELWKNGLITFDTNVILNLYSYSKETRDAILELVVKFKDRIFLTHQVALEYNRNKYEIISEQEKLHNAFLKSLKIIDNDLNSKNKPPFLSDKLQQSLTSVFLNVEEEVKKSISNFQEMLNQDPIFDKIVEIFENKITDKFSEEELVQIYKEGKLRYDKKTPPGYEDNKKSEEHKFGDLVLWKQILNKAKTEKKAIILISDERKEDWLWKIKDGRTIGPRQELVEEIKSFANSDFHIYTSERFLDFGQNYLKGIVNNRAIKEIEEVKKSKIEELIESNKENISIFNQSIEKYLEELTPREADIISSYFGLHEYLPMNYTEIGKIHQMTPIEIKIIKNRALKRIEEMKVNEEISK